MMHILHTVGARTQFIKAAPVMAALAKHRVRQTWVHARRACEGASGAMLREIGLGEPNVTLRIDCGTAAQRTAQLMVAMERCLLECKPDLVLVYGDSDVTAGAALTAVKLGCDVGHVEAGLRSDDRWASDSVNRIVTDRLSSWLFTPSDDADDNLLAEGADPGAIKLVGNVMIDTLIRLLPLTQPEPLMHMLGIMNGKGPVPYGLATMHKPSTIDDQPTFDRLLDALTELARDIPVVFPAHPSTRRRMKEHHLKFSGLLVTEPMTYLQFIGLQQHAKFVITDSGSIQEETTYLGVPCLTVRDDTERPATTTLGTNVLVGRDSDALKKHARHVLAGKGKRGSIPPLWDGKAAERIATHLVNELRA
jgi:UDP-N-acetylglucosamine 2-epimerase (non-hydrolysing)